MFSPFELNDKGQAHDIVAKAIKTLKSKLEHRQFLSFKENQKSRSHRIEKRNRRNYFKIMFQKVQFSMLNEAY